MEHQDEDLWHRCGRGRGIACTALLRSSRSSDCCGEWSSDCRASSCSGGWVSLWWNLSLHSLAVQHHSWHPGSGSWVAGNKETSFHLEMKEGCIPSLLVTCGSPEMLSILKEVPSFFPRTHADFLSIGSKSTNIKSGLSHYSEVYIYSDSLTVLQVKDPTASQQSLHPAPAHTSCDPLRQTAAGLLAGLGCGGMDEACASELAEQC